MKFIRSNLRIMLLITVAILLTGSIFLIIWKVTHRSNAREDMISVRNAVNDLAILPSTDEEPTLATVDDVTKLSDQSLKKVAKNGDKLLVYVNAGKVFIYRPSMHKIVDIQPLIVNDGSAAQASGTRISVFNGSGNSAATSSLASELQTQYPSLKSVTTGTANRLDYPSTIVIDLTDNESKYDLVSNLAKDIGGQRGVLPTGLEKPKNTDVLIIVGSDKN